MFRREDGSWAVARLIDDNDDMHTVVGALLGIEIGDQVRCDGSWIDDPRFGRQLAIKEVAAIRPNTELGIRRFLEGGAVPGVGPALAERIVGQFGNDTLRIIDDEPERLTEVPGIGKGRAQAIAEAMVDRRHNRELLVFLRGHDIPPALSARIAAQYGARAMIIVRREPYRLAEEVRGIGFRTADAIAKSQGITGEDPARLRAGLIYTLQNAAGQGSAALPVDELLQQATELLEVGSEATEAALAAVTLRGALRTEDLGEGELVYLPELHSAELHTAQAIDKLRNAKRPRMAKDAEQAVLWAQEQSGLVLGPDQRAALVAGLEEGFFILTGGPGTGKTTCVRAVLAIAEARGLKTSLCAPTGRAAKRLYEATGREAKTIHRLLEYNPAFKKFGRDSGSPLQTEMLIVDEASMIDLPLASALLDAVPEGCRVWFVGDVDQLPSVGPGQVLRDLIDSGAAGVGRLEEIHRQAEGSTIIEAAHQVRVGEYPTARGQDFFVIHREESERIAEGVLEMVAERIPNAFDLDPIDDVQILTPMRRGILGAKNLNQLLRERLNPLRPGMGELRRGERLYRQGDRIIQIANDYDLDLFNGDTGRILTVDADNKALNVDFDGRVLRIDGEALNRVEPAYALTIHKSQGSEYPAVIIPLHHQHFIMLRRNLLYTALTRGKELVVLIAPTRAIGRAVRTEGGSRRWSGLEARLRALDE